MYFSHYVYVAEATPKSLMRVMGIPGLTLYHLKSHLQVSYSFSYTESKNYKSLSLFDFLVITEI